MKKTVIVINGCGGVGKDTLCEMAGKHFRVKNVSSITAIKEIATQCGWNGEKDPKSRKFLSDLKKITAEYNDFPTQSVYAAYQDFLSSDEEIMFVHIREAEEIHKFLKLTENRAKTLLIQGGDRIPRSRFGNLSDDLVEAFPYDWYFVNDNPLEETEQIFLNFLRSKLQAL